MARQKTAFLVHLWFESSLAGKVPRLHLRGSVVHLKSFERRSFNDMVDLVAFLAAYAGAPERDDVDARR